MTSSADTERRTGPTAREVLVATAADHGVCARPVALRRTNIATGETSLVDVPCGATLADKCPSCAERARKLRMAQCREGWHRTTEPEILREEPTRQQKDLVTERADLTHIRDLTADAGADTEPVDASIQETDEHLSDSGVRGTLPAPGEDSSDRPARRVRSTRRREDVPDLPRHPVNPRTVGRVYTAPDGTTFRPSLFVTLTLDSYGPVRGDGTPVDPDSYNYLRAARDALHFSKLVDRFAQNLRRVVGWNVQYFAVVEPQRRLAPHVHLAIRGTLPRAVLRQVVAATYHQVWWPQCDIAAHTVNTPPKWSDERGAYVDPRDGGTLPTWEQALDALDTEDAQPAHVVRFGPVMNAQGVLAGNTVAARCIRYLCKYLTKALHTIYTPVTQDQADHAARLHDVLRTQPCSPHCPNWLLYGVQPKDARPGMRPGACRAKAHRPAHLGYPGRRVLVSRQWSGKTLTDHRADRRAWAIEQLKAAGEHVESSADASRYTWDTTTSADPDVSPLRVRILRAIAHRAEWRRLLGNTTGPAPPHPDVPHIHSHADHTGDHHT